MPEQIVRSLPFQEPSENAVLVLWRTIKRFGTPATILSDNGSCIVDMRRGHSKGS